MHAPKRKWGTAVPWFFLASVAWAKLTSLRNFIGNVIKQSIHASSGASPSYGAFGKFEEHSSQVIRVVLGCTSSNPYTSSVLFKLPACIITRWCTLKHEPVVNHFTPTERSRLRCHVCLEPLSLENCTAVQTLRLCETGFSCYTLQAFETILNTDIFAKGCIPEIFCSGNRGCEFLNGSRNGSIESCSFHCCHTEQCNAGQSVSSTNPPLPMTTEEPIIQTAVPTTPPGKVSPRNREIYTFLYFE